MDRNFDTSLGRQRALSFGPIRGFLLACILALSACKRDEIAAYVAPKDTSAPPAAAAPTPVHASSPASMPPQPGLRWTSLPEGWVSKGSAGLRVANFSIQGASSDRSAELAVIPLPGTGGSDLDLVNLWRGQLGLQPIDETALAAHSEAMEIQGKPVKLFHIIGEGTADRQLGTNQLLVAAVRKDDFTWFFKLAGDAATVNASRDSFKAFLANVEFTAPQEAAASRQDMASAPSAAGSGAPPTPNWSVPTGWATAPPTSMVLHKWTAGSGATPAEITVSAFPGDTGGPIANLNRWRGQVGLPQAPESELTPLVNNFDVLGGKATLADFTGNRRVIGIIVPRDGMSWFYKMVGTPEDVEGQREAFITFVRTVEYRSPRS